MVLNPKYQDQEAHCIIDTRHIPDDLFINRVLSEAIWVYPGLFFLAVTRERIVLGDNVVGKLHGKSTLGRLGLSIHQTAGFIDPGFSGHLTLEGKVVGDIGLFLYSGMPIAQLELEFLDVPADGGYQGRYQDQPGTPTPPRNRKEVPVE